MKSNLKNHLDDIFKEVKEENSDVVIDNDLSRQLRICTEISAEEFIYQYKESIENHNEKFTVNSEEISYELHMSGECDTALLIEKSNKLGQFKVENIELLYGDNIKKIYNGENFVKKDDLKVALAKAFRKQFSNNLSFKAGLKRLRNIIPDIGDKVVFFDKEKNSYVKGKIVGVDILTDKYSNNKVEKLEMEFEDGKLHTYDRELVESTQIGRENILEKLSKL